MIWEAGPLPPPVRNFLWSGRVKKNVGTPGKLEGTFPSITGSRAHFLLGGIFFLFWFLLTRSSSYTAKVDWKGIRNCKDSVRGNPKEEKE